MHAQINVLCQIPRLYLAWNTVKAKGSSGGVDGITINEFEKEKRKESIDGWHLEASCTECYARITYIPDIKKKEPVKIVVI